MSVSIFRLISSRCSFPAWTDAKAFSTGNNDGFGTRFAWRCWAALSHRKRPVAGEEEEEEEEEKEAAAAQWS